MDWSDLKRPSPMSIPDRLSVDLERLILDGELAPGERLPSERELAEQLEVSRVSVREALRELESRGMIDRRPGRGTIVLAPEDRVATTRLGIPKSLQPELRTWSYVRSLSHPLRGSRLHGLPRVIWCNCENCSNLWSKQYRAPSTRSWILPFIRQLRSTRTTLCWCSSTHRSQNRLLPSRSERYQTNNDVSFQALHTWANLRGDRRR